MVRRLLVAALALALSACASTAPDAGDAGAGATDAATSGPGSGDADGATCADGFFWEADGCTTPASIDLGEVRSGGPPPDGIPPIDDPVLEDVAAADEWLNDTSPVMSIEVDGELRAYPLAIMTWHEIVNDEVAGEPVTVTYCPLCNSGLAFERTTTGPDGEQLVLDFGTTGRLWRSNLVMYDRQTRTLWSQFTGEAIAGEALLGTTLERVPTATLGWGEFKALAGSEQAAVLSRDTGHDRPYGTNPYAGYDDSGAEPFLFDGSSDDRLPKLERVTGIGDADAATAVQRSWVEEAGLVTVDVGDEPVVVVHAPGASSALDTRMIDEGREVGAVAVFSAVVDGERRSFERAERDGATVLVDDTGTTWDLAGRPVDGPDAGSGTTLQALAHDDTFWFVWFVFLPETELVGADGPIG